MISPMRRLLFTSLAGLITGCGSVAERPDEVAVNASTLTAKYSTIEARVERDQSEVESTFTASLDPSIETLTRLESSYTQTLGGASQHLRLGDTVSSSGMWGNSVRYGGVQFGTSAQSQSSAQSNALSNSTLAASGLAVLPTAVDALFASINTEESLLARQNLSVGSVGIKGDNTLGFTARDSLGRSQTITAPMIENARLVQSGCSDFAVGLGKVRRDFAVTSNDYGPVFANTTVACAAPLGFTIEGHGEYLADEVAALGVGIARQLSWLGTASVAVASSQAEIGAGWLARIGFEHQNSLFNVMLRSRIQSREFRDVGSAWSIDPVMQRNLASVGLNTGPTSNLALAYASQTTWAQERSNLISLSQSLALGRGSVSMSAGHSLVDSVGSSVFVSYQRPFGWAPRRSVVREFDLDLFNIPLMN
jgi:outer membrane usher protein